MFTDGDVDLIEITALTVPTRFSGFEDYWRPFLGGQGPAPTYVASLDDAARSGFADSLEWTTAASPHGEIELTARAWAVKGLFT